MSFWFPITQGTPYSSWLATFAPIPSRTSIGYSFTGVGSSPGHFLAGLCAPSTHQCLPHCATQILCCNAKERRQQLCWQANPTSLQAMGWAGLFITSAGTGVAGMLLCGLLGILYTLGFIVASAGEYGPVPHSPHPCTQPRGLRCPTSLGEAGAGDGLGTPSDLAEVIFYCGSDWKGFVFLLQAICGPQSIAVCISFLKMCTV